MPNQLAGETSPYLLQHANNPVDWHPWGPKALTRAKAEDKPIFLSIGYSACHWCHVMEHESFENEAIAARLNESFVSVKVDREERPDLDHIYMSAVQAISGRGGWPMSVFLTPDLEPFFGGTYWPPTGRQGMPGFDQVLASVSDAWTNRREQAVSQARELTAQLQSAPLADSASASELSAAPLAAAAAALERIFDHRQGGFGGAPKFPHPMDIRVLLRIWRRDPREGMLKMVTLTLDKMAAGGIYDHLGGGFHRYAVDDRWLVPHFEKMLYDNALLAGCYLEAAQATGDADYARVVRETLDYVLREMTAAEGGFFSTQDADSEGEEGKFYVWSAAEVDTLLGDAARAFSYSYDVSEEGNFEGHNILNRPKTLQQCSQILSRDPSELAAELARGRATLLAARERRIKPGLDDKVLTSWNALMIDAMASAASYLDEPRYLRAAAAAADFVLTRMRRDDGRLLHSFRQGQARFDAYVDDYSYLIQALVTLYEADFNERWIDEAARLADIMLTRFADPAGGFFFTADDHERLIARHKDFQDSSVPSGNAMAATALLRLGKLTGSDEYLSAGEGTLAAFVEIMKRHPTAAGQMLLALDFHLGPTPEIVIVGDRDDAGTAAALADLRRRYMPNKVVACRPAKAAPSGSQRLDAIFRGKTAEQPPPAVYICENFACQAPVKGPAAAGAAFDKLSPPAR